MAERNAGNFAKIAIFNVQIGMAHPAALHPQRRFAVLQRAKLFVLNVHGMVFGHYGSFHGGFLS